MSGESENSQRGDKLDVALCMDEGALRRFRAALRHLCVGLIDAAVQVRVLTSSAEAEALSLGSVQIVRHPPLAWPRRVHTLGLLRNALEDRPPTTVHGFGVGGYEVASEIASEVNSDLVLHVLGLEDVRGLQLVSPDRMDWVVAASQPLLDRILALEGVRKDRVSLIRPGILAGDRATCFDEADRIPTVLCTRQLTPSCGVESLLEAVRILLGRGHEFLTFLTGSGPQEDALRRMVRGQKLTSAITFASPTADFRQILADADVFVRPAVENSLSVRVLQSLAAGTATIALDGGVGDACIDGETALVCPDDRPFTLAAAIERLLTAPAFARTLAANGVRHVKKHHSLSASCAALLAVYRDLALRGRTLTT